MFEHFWPCLLHGQRLLEHPFLHALQLTKSVLTLVLASILTPVLAPVLTLVLAPVEVGNGLQKNNWKIFNRYLLMQL